MRGVCADNAGWGKKLLKDEACRFLEWAVSEGWVNYDGHDRWINPPSMIVLETKHLYDKYKNNDSKIQ